MIKKYAKNDRSFVSKNFQVREFSCHGSGCCGETLVDEKLVEYLQKIREHFGQPVTLNSGYRCAVHNKAVGGAGGSLHVKGQAADISVKGVAPAEVAKYAESIGVLGIGLYETDKDGYFVHIDTRTYKSFWYGQREEKRDTFGGAKKEPAKAEFSVGMRNLKKGCKGGDVKALQILLIGNGYSCGKYGADGDFGSGTLAAVQTFQSAKGLDADGIAGKNTMRALLGV